MISRKLLQFRDNYFFLIFIVLANAWFIPSVYLEVVRYLRAPPDTLFTFVHTDFVYDYNVYLSAISQGIFGHWLYRNPYTTGPQSAGIFYILYIAIGKMAALFHLWAPVAYHVAKFFIVEFFIIVSYFLCAFILGPAAGFWAAIFGLSATVAPIALFGAPGAYVTYTPWWNLIESLNRLDQVPHYIAAQAGMMGSVLFVFFYFRKKQWQYLVPASLFAVIAAIMLPSSIFPVLFGFPLSAGLLIVRAVLSRPKKQDIPWLFIAGLASVCLTVAVTLVFMWRQTAGDPVWVQYKLWEVAQWNKDPLFFRSLVLSFGILPILGVGGFLWCVMKGKWSHIFIAVWAVLPFLMVPWINLLGMGKIRVMNQAPFVPMGILAAMSLFILRPANKIAGAAWTCGGVLLFILFTAGPTWQIYNIHLTTAKTSVLRYNEYLPRSVMSAIDYTNASIPANSAFISEVGLGNLLPSYTQMRGFLGHIGQTPDFAEKENEMKQFFDGSLNGQQALAFVKLHGISYAYYVPIENPQPMPAYTFLTRIFTNPDITIYRVTE